MASLRQPKRPRDGQRAAASTNQPTISAAPAPAPAPDAQPDAPKRRRSALHDISTKQQPTASEQHASSKIASSASLEHDAEQSGNAQHVVAAKPAAKRASRCSTRLQQRQQQSVAVQPESDHQPDRVVAVATQEVVLPAGNRANQLASSDQQNNSVPTNVHANLVTNDAKRRIRQWEIEQASSRQVVDYSEHIYRHLRMSELLNNPAPSYMDQVQGDLSFAMRAILLDWLIEVQEEFHLHAQTYHLSVYYVDRYLSAVAIERGKLQLVGLAALMIAAKYWEIYPPTIDDFVHICDNTYKRDEILSTESAMLNELAYQLVKPTAWEFLNRLHTQLGVSAADMALSEYLVELSLQEAYTLTFCCSLLATAAMLLTLLMRTGRHLIVEGSKDHKERVATVWTSHLVRASGYALDAQLLACVKCVHATHERVFLDSNGSVAMGNAGFKAVKDKYLHSARHRAATVVPLALAL